MPKIYFLDPGEEKASDDASMIDTQGNPVEICEAFLPVMFRTAEGERLAVVMRDSGFEVSYSADFGDKGFDAGWTIYNNGHVQHSKEMSAQRDSEKNVNAQGPPYVHTMGPDTHTDVPPFPPVLIVTPEMRQDAYIKASDFVAKIVSQHGLEAYRSGSPFGVGMTVSTADQHNEMIIRVATWMLGEDDD